MLLIGSRALMLRTPQLLSRKPLDFDFICSKQEYETWMKANESKIQPTDIYPELDGQKMIVKGPGGICEFEFIQPGHSTELLDKLVRADKDTIETSFGLVPSLDLLFTIKDAHKYKKFNYDPRMFWKTAIDWHAMKRYGARQRSEYEEFWRLRQKESYNYAHPRLNVSKDAFFKDDSIVYTYDHDTIHQSVAIGENPAYINYLRDGAEVDCDKEKFFACSQDVRLNGVVEEASVLAIERSLVPHPNAKTPKEAWLFALAKVCSSITSGWFRRFAYENMFDAIRLFNDKQTGYWDKFQRDVETGLVRSI